MIKRTFLFQCLVCAWLLCAHIFAWSLPANTLAADEAEIKVLTFNVLNGFSNSSGKCGKSSRSANLVQYLKENAIDVVFLQEAGCSSALADQWGEAVGGSIDVIESSYINKKMAILSRIPMERNADGTIRNSDSVQYAGDRKTQSVRIKKDTTFIRLFNIHPHNFCSEQSSIFDFINQFTSENVPYIIAGDFNSTNVSLGECVAQLDTRFARTCAADRACPRSTTGGNSVGFNPIDHIMVLKSAGTVESSVLAGRCLNGTALLESISDHWPVEAIVKITLRSVKTGDLNDDGVIDIYDYNIFLEVFGHTGTPGFHPGDIIKNGIIDIYDYNELLKALTA